MAEEKRNYAYALIAIVAVVAIAGLVMMFKGGKETISYTPVTSGSENLVPETSTLTDESNLAGEAPIAGYSQCGNFENMCEISWTYDWHCDYVGPLDGTYADPITAKYSCSCIGSAGTLWKHDCGGVVDKTRYVLKR
jgi:hypothetical protein